jgi:hypothetical protein
MTYSTDSTLQITGGKKQSEERAALLKVRVHLPFRAFTLPGADQWNICFHTLLWQP